MSKTSHRRVDYWKDPRAPKPTSRKPSASVFVRREGGDLLLLRRTDNDLWTIPTGGIKKGETITECGVRECREETGLVVQITGLVGVFSTPDHVIAYLHGDKLDEVRQPINICLRARPIGGQMEADPREAQEVRWVNVAELNDYHIHPAIRRRIDAGLGSGDPHLD